MKPGAWFPIMLFSWQFLPFTLTSLKISIEAFTLICVRLCKRWNSATSPLFAPWPCHFTAFTSADWSLMWTYVHEYSHTQTPETLRWLHIHTTRARSRCFCSQGTNFTPGKQYFIILAVVLSANSRWAPERKLIIFLYLSNGCELRAAGKSLCCFSCQDSDTLISLVTKTATLSQRNVLFKMCFYLKVPERTFWVMLKKSGI